MKMKHKVLTGVAAVALSFSLVGAGAVAPAVAAPTSVSYSAPMIGGGSSKADPVAMCWAAWILTPWDKIAQRKWCNGKRF